MTITYNLLGIDGPYDGGCEAEQSIEGLRSKNKYKLFCNKMEGIIRERNAPPVQEGVITSLANRLADTLFGRRKK